MRRHSTKQYELAGGNYIPKNGEDRYYGQELDGDFRYLQGIHGDNVLSRTGKASILQYGGKITEGSDKQRINISAAGGFAEFAIKAIDETQPWQLPPVMKNDTTKAPVMFDGISNYRMVDATLDGVTVNYVKIRYLEYVESQTRSKMYISGTFSYLTKATAQLVVDSVAPTSADIFLGTVVGNGSSTLVIKNNTPIRCDKEIFNIDTSVTDIVSAYIDTEYIVDSTSGSRQININGTSYEDNIEITIRCVSGTYATQINYNSSPLETIILNTNSHIKLKFINGEWVLIESDLNNGGVVGGDLSVIGDVSGEKGIFTDDVSGVDGTFSGDVSGVKGTFSGHLQGNERLKITSPIRKVSGTTLHTENDWFDWLVTYMPTFPSTEIVLARGALNNKTVIGFDWGFGLDSTQITVRNEGASFVIRNGNTTTMTGAIALC